MSQLLAYLAGRPLALAPASLEALLAMSPLGSPFEAQSPSTDSATRVVTIGGPLLGRGNMLTRLFGLADYETVVGQVEEAVADPEVRRVVLDLDSPGGEAAGMFDGAQRIRELSRVKPIVAVVNSHCFSAAYALASAGTEVVVPRAGGLGSIGVIAAHLDKSAHDAKEGFRLTVLTHGAEKADLSPHAPLSERARAKLQADVDELGSMFDSLVARHRGLDAETVRGFEAGTFLGEAAVDAGLADRVGSLREVLAEAPERRSPFRQRSARPFPISGGFGAFPTRERLAERERTS